MRERTLDTRLDRTEPLHDEADRLPLQPTEAAEPPQLCADATGSGISHAPKATKAMTAKRIEKRIVNLQKGVRTETKVVGKSDYHAAAQGREESRLPLE